MNVAHPEWARDAAIYEINTRQFTPEGTFRAAERELPRLKALNVGILWVMPIHEIGRANRKGALGSPYAVRDYYSVNPEFGTLGDFRRFVAAAHARGLRVILDWVANHTAWDNPLLERHPGWYQRGWNGNFRPPPWQDWSDVVSLDYRQPGLRRYMAGAMRHWVEETGIDGYRCDVAGFVPVGFWNRVRRELDRIRPVFLLAEWESRDLHARAFDATYAWSWYDAVRGIARGTGGLRELRAYYSWNEGSFPPGSIRMTFVSNQDKNSWEGTEFEQFGDALEAAIALSVVGDGMPLIYNGQEAGNAQRLKFFERDPIAWREHPLGGLYRRLLALKRANTALWNGGWGAAMVDVPNSAPSHVLSFVRRNDRDRVFAAFNFSGRARTAALGDGPYPGSYEDPFSGRRVELRAGSRLRLEPWKFLVLVQ